jgi:FtsP/CotA-like multicopper oxidase with cupredoxin domain
MDGAGHMTKPIEAGKSFDYDFVAIDPGLYWFHPHVRADVQVEKGLYGALLVRDPDEPKLASREVVLLLDDVRVDPATGLPEVQADTRAAMMGREGNLILVNGKPANGSVEVRPGERVRLRLVNTANARYLSLGLRGGKLVQIGGDGGLLPAPRPQDGLLLVPGERADVLVEIPAGGGPLVLVAQPYERAIGARPTVAVDLVRFVAKGDAAPEPPPLPTSLRAIETLPTPTITRQLQLDERMGYHTWEFTINGKTFPNVPLLKGKPGSRELWIVENKSNMDHPFHLHGFFFQVDGAPAWKDTVNVPGRKAVRLAIDVDAREGAAGGWMYHCHILEHAEGGMMGELHVQ